MHPWEQPFERIVALAREHQVDLTTPVMGQRVDMAAPEAGMAWWRDAAAGR
ncbi:hypothetical protein D3C87_1215370 [compost metagenome]